MNRQEFKCASFTRVSALILFVLSCAAFGQTRPSETCGTNGIMYCERTKIGFGSEPSTLTVADPNSNAVIIPQEMVPIVEILEKRIAELEAKVKELEGKASDQAIFIGPSTLPYECNSAKNNCGQIPR